MNNSAKYCLKRKNKILWLYLVGFLLLGMTAVLGIMIGSTKLTFEEIGQAFTQGFHSSAGARIFAYVRFPRTASSLVCGAALSVSGAVIQVVLTNQLASPSIIGVNSGAGLAVTVCAAFGIYGGLQLSVFSFLGAFAAVMLVNLASHKWGASRGTVILIGVAMNSLLGAVSDTIVTFVPDIGIISNSFKIGDFSSVTYEKLLPAATIVLVTLIVLFTLTNELDVLTLGDDSAKGLGMNTAFLRTLFLLLAAILAGCAVSLAGLLSFVGLIVPHAVRRVTGNKSSHLLPLCALYGASFVCLCDTMSRTLLAPYEIPVGIFMAFLGAPFFVFILVRGKGGYHRD